MNRIFSHIARITQLPAAHPCALSPLPSWSATLRLLLLVGLHGCVISDARSCHGCHRDCGFGRKDCHDACDESEACVAQKSDVEARS
jgi:hypothetical protein